MRLSRVKATASIAALFLALIPSAAHAQQSAESAAAAEQLFQDAKSLAAAGNWEAACQKFDASYALDSALGTLLNSADCHERVGKTASAWAQFLEAGTRARRNNQPDREATAAERANALAPRLTRLKIVVPQEARALGLEIRADGTLQPEESWDVAIPVDPGPVVIRVSAPTKQDWGTVVDVQGEGKTAEITIPILKDAEPVAPPPHVLPIPQPGYEPKPPPPASSSSWGTQKIVGVAVAGAGVVGVAVGSIFGVVAISKWNGGADCPNDKCVNNDAQQKAQDAKTFGNVSTVLFVVGGAALAGGAVLYFTAPKQSSVSVGLSPILSPSAGGASLTGRF
jgi:hypothetical protein